MRFMTSFILNSSALRPGGDNMILNSMKTTYQRNMIAGTVISCLLILIPAVILHFSERSTVIIQLNNISHEPSKRSWLRSKNVNSDDWGGWGYGLEPTPMNNPAAGYKVVGDNEIGPVMFGSIMMAMPQILLMSNESELPTGDGLGYNGISYFPNSADDEYPISDRTPRYAYDQPIFTLFTERRITHNSKMPDREMCIYFPEKITNLPAIYYKEEPAVILGITINAKGQILDISTIYENPADRGFAKRIREILIQDAYIQPAIRDGKQVGGDYLFSWQYSNKGGGKTLTKSTADVNVMLINDN